MRNSKKRSIGVFITWIIAYSVGFFLLDIEIWKILLLGLIIGIPLIFLLEYYRDEADHPGEVND